MQLLWRTALIVGFGGVTPPTTTTTAKKSSACNTTPGVRIPTAVELEQPRTCNLCGGRVVLVLVGDRILVPISKSDESPVKIYVSVYFTYSTVSKIPRSLAPYCRCRTPLQFEDRQIRP